MMTPSRLHSMFRAAALVAACAVSWGGGTLAAADHGTPPSAEHAAVEEAKTDDHDKTPSGHEPAESGEPLPFLDNGSAIHSKNLLPVAKPVPKHETRDYQKDLDFARDLRKRLSYKQAERALEGLLTTNAPSEIHRQALLEIAFMAEEQRDLTRAAQVFSQYITRFPDHATIPEVYLRQGLIYRELGAHRMAVSRFYLVMSSSLQLKLDQMAYYKRLVLQAQTEIADTVFLDANYEEAARLYERMLRQESPELNRPHVHFKLIRCLSALDKKPSTLAEGESFLEKHPEAEEVPEVRFLLARIYKELGRNGDATRQVLSLLEKQQASQKANPERWAHWRQRAGNDLANQFYKDGDYLNALTIYNAMADIGSDPEWRLPVLYQTGLIYERLQQTAKATAVYDQIVEGAKTLDPDTMGPSLKSVLDMAKWRKSHLEWIEKSAIERELLRPPSVVSNAAASL